MLAMTYDRFGEYGDFSALTLQEVPDPKVGPGEVLIRVRSAAVNPVDWKIMSGGLDSMFNSVFPIIPGWDVAGVVESVGPDTPEFCPGDEVFSYGRKDVLHGGSFAELISVPARSVALKPSSLSFDEAAGLPLAGMTAARAFDRVGLTEAASADAPSADAGSLGKRTVLIHGAAGGVGSFGVQIAVARGARVIGTASEANHDYLRSLGAEPVAYGNGLVERVRELAPDGVNFVVDFVGGVLDQTLAVIADGGGHASVAQPEVEGQGGSWVWVRPDGDELDKLGELAEAGQVQVSIAGTYPLAGLRAAFEESKGGHTRGKLIIHVSDPA